MPTFSDAYGKVLANQRNLMELATVQEDRQYLRQQRTLQAQEREQQAQQQAKISALMQEEGQEAKPLTQYGTDPAPLLLTGQKYIDAGRAIAVDDPKAGAELIKQGDEILTAANKRSTEQLKQKQEVLSQITNWFSGVKDQASLDYARQMAETYSPGILKSLPIPTVYDAAAKQKIEQVKQASMTQLQQADLAIKQMHLEEDRKYKQAQTDKEQALAHKARRDAARSQSGLSKKTVKDPLEAYDNKILSESQLYEKEKADVLKDTKKYSTKEKEVGQLWWKEKQPSPQAVALSAIEKAHQGRLAAINSWAKARGVPIKQEASAAAIAYLRENDSPEVRQAFEDKYGYLPD